MTFTKNNYNPAIHHRKSIRLKGYDYSSPGYYFVTICTQNRVCLFGEIINGKMQLNDAGNMVDLQWATLPHRFKNIRIDEYSVMPNHFHAILEIVSPVGTPLVGAPTGMGVAGAGAPTRGAPALGEMIGAFQSIVTVEYIRGVKTNNWQSFQKKLWQRNYWEHIIRNDQELMRIRYYIKNNPSNWNCDKLSSANGNRVQETIEYYGEDSWMI
jgi:REP element-mobilizing transposase RayT